MTSLDTTKQRPIIMYLLGIIQMLVILWATYMMGRVDRVEAEQVQHEKAAQTLVREFEGRVSALEAQFTAIQVQLNRIEAAVMKEGAK